MRGFFAILTMAVTYTEVVSEIAPIHVRVEYKGILVLFSRIIRYKTYTSSKSIFSYHVSFY